MSRRKKPNPRNLPKRHYLAKDRPEDIVGKWVRMQRRLRDAINLNAEANGVSAETWVVAALEHAVTTEFRVQCQHPIRYRAGGYCWAPGCHLPVEGTMRVGTEEEQPPAPPGE